MIDQAITRLERAEARALEDQRTRALHEEIVRRVMLRRDAWELHLRAPWVSVDEAQALLEAEPG